MSTGFDPGPLADASVAGDAGRWSLIFVRALPHPPEKVWAALTDPAGAVFWISLPLASGESLARHDPRR